MAIFLDELFRVKCGLQDIEDFMEKAIKNKEDVTEELNMALEEYKKASDNFINYITKKYNLNK